MKRILALTLATLLALSLAACDPHTLDDSPDENVTRTEFETADSAVFAAVEAGDVNTITAALDPDYRLSHTDDELVAEVDGHELTVAWHNTYYDGRTTVRYVAYADGSDLDAALVSRNAADLTGVAIPETDVAAYMEQATSNETTDGGTVALANDDETISVYAGTKNRVEILIRVSDIM